MLEWINLPHADGCTIEGYSGNVLVVSMWITDQKVRIKSKFFRGRAWRASDIYVSGTKPLPTESELKAIAQRKWDMWKKEANLG